MHGGGGTSRAARPAARGGAASPSGRQEKTVTFKNVETKKTLTGTLLAVPNSKKVVILCHGFASFRNGFHFPALAKALAQKNIASLRFDFSGNGDSEGPFEFGNYAVESKDIRAAVTFLHGLKYEVVGLIGHSKGAGSVLLYASLHDDIPNVVNIAGRFDLKRGLTERFGSDLFDRIAREKEMDLETKRDDGTVIEWTLTKWSLQDRLDTDMEAIAKKIRLTEVLTIHGSADQTIPVADAHQWGKHIATHQLQIIDGADHNFTQPAHAQAMIGLAVQFMHHD